MVSPVRIVSLIQAKIHWVREHTWWQTLLQLLCLIRVLEHERVDESLASDLELDVVGLLVLLYAGSYSKCISI